MQKFQWNTSVVYNLPYSINSIAPSVQVIDHEYHLNKIEKTVSEMTKFPEAAKMLEKIFNQD